ncbi:MAG: type 1 glutamine amidotransferase [Leptospiraceae bacterium]|nr:type 1 glutamine amidotransferase [Leptospiraceae bacterium]MDW7976713.1 type 1 glutamine amidotransferase [Leptospiraceae bacterium]
MKICYFQHVDFEDPAAIFDWVKERNYIINGFHIYQNQIFPNIDDYDLFIFMGGSMSVYEDDQYPWLKQEKYFLEKIIKQQKKILGICLGAQLIAEVLGAKVYPNHHKEIGWHIVNSTDEAKKYGIFPDVFHAFHWHGDTFDNPNGSKHLFYNDATQHQGFVYQDHVWAFQFHLETNLDSIQKLYHHSKSDLNALNQTYIKPFNIEESMIHIPTSNGILFRFLDFLSGYQK